MLAINSLAIWGVLLNTISVLAVPVVVESLNETPAGWEESNSPEPDKLIDFSIGLEPENHELLERAIYEVSDPDHANYGKHLSRESAKALLNPSRAATESVKRWLSDAGVPEHHVRDDGQWLHVRTTVSKAEGMLSTRFSVFARDDERVVRTREYSVPLEIRQHIATIQPTTFFPSLKKIRSDEAASILTERDTKYETKPSTTNDGNNGGPGSVDLEKCKTTVTPACIRKIYNMPLRDYPKAEKGSLYTIVGFHNNTAQDSELQEFLRRFAPDIKGTKFSDASANGGSNPQGDNYPSGEGNLDIQYAVSLAHKVPVQYLAVGGFNADFNPDLDMRKIPGDYDRTIEPWLEFTEYILNLPNKKLPQVISISWGENEQHVPKQYARQVCNKFGQIGTRGVSIVVPAGNQGVGISCQSNDGKNTTKFLPNFPSGCPYVTAVGGTESNSPEKVWYTTQYQASGGGGFSDYWPRPWWQDNVVKDYLKKYGNKRKQYYNQNGRAYPDVSALAWGHQVMNHGQLLTTGGTSVATPTFGAIVNLLNNERLKKGKPPMGFLNPWLYKSGHAGFTDITVGKTAGCFGTSREGFPAPKIPNAGWDAVKGWDPASGWGTPRFDKLRQLAT
ncbi:hypothetical protein FSARC_8238 [Fusarium sarcochroum]|uniref:tripeptidyl-peptidase II n=1 Tax=Fusarium sarcochroum TaxID=1208366 RepID=A0A8H4X747_9HYPO|nr:hypothetical protein FSARC_8238 [Fusarium sarcochroum]